jgi:hypothetical protein
MTDWEGRKNPFIGVNGVVNYESVQPNGLVVHEPQDLFLEKYAADAGLFDTGRHLALGVKATLATQWYDKPYKHDGKVYGSELYPVGEEQMANALKPKGRNPNIMGVAQINMGTLPLHRGNSKTREDYVDKVVRRSQRWIRAVQFDEMRWHENDDMLKLVADTKSMYSEQDLKIILHCGKETMVELGEARVAQKLGQYAHAVDYVLFDMSHGMGKRFSPDVMDDFLDRAYSNGALDSIGFAVAGGLDADAVNEDLPWLLEKYKDLSWWASGYKLHPLNNARKRALQMDGAKEFLQASVDITRQ